MEYNSKKNIISGPGLHDYWNHSYGLERPVVREEGPFPIQGNIGSLLKQEEDGNYSNCNQNSLVGGSPNCVGVFNKDIYTKENTCGENCDSIGVESYGLNSFGMIKGIDTNIHSLHAYQNIRAGVDGQGPSADYGCYEWVPTLTKTNNNSCKNNYSTYEQYTVGDFTKLNNWKSFTNQF